MDERETISQEQIIRIIKELEMGVKSIDIFRKYGISEQTFYKWKSKYGIWNTKKRGLIALLEIERRMNLSKNINPCCKRKDSI